MRDSTAMKGRDGSKFLMRHAALLSMIFLAGFSAADRADGSKHSVTVTFDYNFGLTPACSDKVTDNCVKQFNVYDISAGVENRTRLFTIPVDPAAKGVVKGITGSSPLLLFAPGKHLISVVAQTPSNQKSDPGACTAWIEIK
jgi:hypothetical protein